MVNPQTLEAIFIAGSLLVGMTGSRIHWAEPGARLLNESCALVRQIEPRVKPMTNGIGLHLIRSTPLPLQRAARD